MAEDPAEQAATQYRAFISYSHADSRFAAWLHRRLEAAPLPDKSRLTPIFLDRAELAADPDLPAQVRTALAASAALVVVASPAARVSRWVAQEIALFRDLHPDRPVLTALVEGEPGEAFPTPLTEHRGALLEPLAADFRKGHDGKRLGLIKIVAGLSGLPLDRLVQRDAQMRQRRVMAVTAGAVLLSIVLGALLVIAVRARSEAERQRAEAEGMVEFMLTDLREKLKGVGRLDVMEAVNQRAMRHYAGQDLSRLPDDSLARRARLLHAMGEDDQKRADHVAAEKKYREAHRVTAAILARNPKDPEAIFTHAQSEYWIGAAEKALDRPQNTLGPWRGYLRQAEALAAVEPETARSMMELGYAHGNLCDLSADLAAQEAELLVHCRPAYEFEEKALKLAPENRSIALDLANRYGWQAIHMGRKGKHAEALAFRKKELAMIERLIALDPRNLEYRSRRQTAVFGIGKVLVEMGRPVEALLPLKESLAAYQSLEKEMPGDAEVAYVHLRTAWWIARASIESGQPDRAARMAYLHTLYARVNKTLPPQSAAQWSGFIAQLETEPGHGN